MPLVMMLPSQFVSDPYRYLDMHVYVYVYIHIYICIIVCKCMDIYMYKYTLHASGDDAAVAVRG